MQGFLPKKKQTRPKVIFAQYLAYILWQNFSKLLKHCPCSLVSCIIFLLQKTCILLKFQLLQECLKSAAYANTTLCKTETDTENVVSCTIPAKLYLSYDISMCTCTVNRKKLGGVLP